MKSIDKRIKVGSWVAGTWASVHDGWYLVKEVDPLRKWVMLEGNKYPTPAEDIKFFTNSNDRDLLFDSARRNRRDYIRSIAESQG